MFLWILLQKLITRMQTLNSFCCATGRHLDLHTLNIAFCSIRVNHREVKVRAQRAKRRSLLLSHLSSLQYTQHFPLRCDLKPLFGNENLVVAIMSLDDLQLKYECGVVPPIPAMWNCCAWIHRGAVYCGTTHSTHCFCTLNDRLSHNVKSKWRLCANVICMQTASSRGQRWGLGLNED